MTRGAINAIQVDRKDRGVRSPRSSCVDVLDVVDRHDTRGPVIRLHPSFEAVVRIGSVHDHHGVTREIGELCCHREGDRAIKRGVEDHRRLGLGRIAIRMARSTRGSC